MYNSTQVSPGDVTLADQYNDLREDTLFNAGDYATTTGSANTYLLSIDTDFVEVEGAKIRVKFHVANTGASTINVNGGGAVAIKKFGNADYANGEIKVGMILDLVFDGTNYQAPNTASSSSGISELDNGTYNDNDLLESIEADGVAYTFTYDLDGQVASWNDGSVTRVVTRDAQGNLISVLEQ